MKAPIFLRRRLIAALAFAFGCALMADAALAQGAPNVRVIEEPVVVQPPPFATRGETVVVPRTRIEIDEGKRPSSGESRTRKKPKSTAAAKDSPPTSPKPEATRTSEAKSVAQPPPLPPAREVAPRTDAGTTPTPNARSKILSGDPLGRKQKKSADNSDGED